jgi:hypothetical protein
VCGSFAAHATAAGTDGAGPIVRDGTVIGGLAVGCAAADSDRRQGGVRQKCSPARRSWGESGDGQRRQKMGARLPHAAGGRPV